MPGPNRARVRARAARGRSLRQAAIDAIDKDVKWFPAWGRDRLYGMVANRPDWCISRQRAWGVPIPAVDCTKCGEALLTPALVERAAGVFDTYGADAWYERPIEEFIPDGLTCPACGGTEFERERDILDVWFDSGSSHEAVLPFRPELTWPADVYLEGSDQHRGWFQSSLLVGLGTRGKPPFRAVVTHGFIVTEDGRKMSKSLGNVDRAGRTSSRRAAPRSSGCGSRWWTTGRKSGSAVRSWRASSRRTARSAIRCAISCRTSTTSIRRSIGSRSSGCTRSIGSRSAGTARRPPPCCAPYDEYDYPTIFQALNQFTTVDLSAFYADVSKDRLYTFAPTSPERRSAQTAMYIIADGLTRLLAPILPVTTDELWHNLPGSREASVHLAEFPRDAATLLDPALLERWEQLMRIRDDVNRALEAERQAKTIGNSLGAQVVLRARGADAALLERYRDDLAMLFIVSQAELETAAGDGPGVEITVARADGDKCPRCWRIVRSVSSAAGTEGLCDRCTDALAATSPLAR